MVSIRAPIRGRGDIHGYNKTTGADVFQSAPRSEDGATNAYLLATQAPELFQSAPRSEDRGDNATCAAR